VRWEDERKVGCCTFVLLCSSALPGGEFWDLLPEFWQPRSIADFRWQIADWQAGLSVALVASCRRRPELAHFLANASGFLFRCFATDQIFRSAARKREPDALARKKRVHAQMANSYLPICRFASDPSCPRWRVYSVAGGSVVVAAGAGFWGQRGTIFAPVQRHFRPPGLVVVKCYILRRV
jgi:hypothetical protein